MEGLQDTGLRWNKPKDDMAKHQLLTAQQTGMARDPRIPWLRKAMLQRHVQLGHDGFIATHEQYMLCKVRLCEFRPNRWLNSEWLIQL